ncbi:hypothetical protein M6B38_154210 [Iris pallida]|uniref:Uncharacterized protein n=1 Tax=Iris pallida TaxID=29817 RepID=A0AAX6F4C1_IRIPA|nr:hypothetical protein M6B38_154210 [Iris pallida]
MARIRSGIVWCSCVRCRLDVQTNVRVRDSVHVVSCPRVPDCSRVQFWIMLVRRTAVGIKSRHA